MWISFQYFRSGCRVQGTGSAVRGFTLIELLTVVSIMLILTSIFLFRQQTFNSATLLRSLAYSVGLSLRQAQIYGTSIRESSLNAFDTAGSSAKAYGIYFSSATPNNYSLFADINNNGIRDTTEDVQVFTINRGYTISKFCATTNSNTAQCSDVGTISQLTILFRRPNPDSCFATTAFANACAIGAAAQYKSAYIQIKSGQDTRSVTITLTGQISVGAKGT